MNHAQTPSTDVEQTNQIEHSHKFTHIKFGSFQGGEGA